MPCAPAMMALSVAFQPVPVPLQLSVGQHSMRQESVPQRIHRTLAGFSASSMPSSRSLSMMSDDITGDPSARLVSLMVRFWQNHSLTSWPSDTVNGRDSFPVACR